MKKAANHLLSIVRNHRSARARWRFFLKEWVQPHDIKYSAAVIETLRFSRVVRPELLQEPLNPDRALIIAPHPDDEVIGMGGSLIAMIDAGTDACVAFVSDGENDASLRATRREEAELSARMCGFKPVFLGLRARGIDIDEKSLQAVQNLVHEFKPDILFIPFLLDDNDDHRRSNELLWRAMADQKFGNEIEIWAYQVYSPIPANCLIDITSMADKKRDAINVYQSQVTKRDWAHFALGMNATNIRWLRRAEKGDYVECFLRLPTREYFELCEAYFQGGADCYYTASYREKQ